MQITAELRTRLIAEAKEREKKEDVVSLINNLPSHRLIMNWPNISLDVPDTHIFPTNHNGIPRQIWAGVECDLDEVSILARIPKAFVLQHLREAQMALWIYPDGTVHKHALELAKATIVRIAKGI